MELNEKQVLKIIELADLNISPSEVDSQMLNRLLVVIEQKLNTMCYCPKDLSFNRNLKILIVDDLELSVYQLTKGLERLGIVPSVARDKQTALAEIKKTDFDYLVLDLYLPDLSDGIELIHEAQKIRQERKIKSKIFIISSTNNDDIINNCKELANAFIPKSSGWHEDILKLIANDINDCCPDSQNFTKLVVDGDIIVYNINKINSGECVEELKNDIKLLLTMGNKNIILNFENIYTMDSQYASLFVDTYKFIANAGGQFVILKPSGDIVLILEETYLSDVIQTAKNLNDAVLKLKRVE